MAWVAGQCSRTSSGFFQSVREGPDVADNLFKMPCGYLREEVFYEKENNHLS